MITTLVLGLIGILALTQFQGLNAIRIWLYFQGGAFVTLVVKALFERCCPTEEAEGDSLLFLDTSDLEEIEDPLKEGHLCSLRAEHDRAFKFYQAAAQRGEKRAHLYLAQMYEEGKGVSQQDLSQAAAHLKRCVKEGDEEAITHLIILLVELNRHDEAIFWYKERCKNGEGNLESQEKFLQCFEKILSSDPPKETLELYKRFFTCPLKLKLAEYKTRRFMSEFKSGIYNLNS